MKLLESAKDLKMSCYIYFIDTKKKFAINNQRVASSYASKRWTFTTTRFERLRDFT